MFTPSQTAFLEALGWTIVNSWWQFGLIWLLFSLLKVALPGLSSAGKYTLALWFLLGGLCWMLLSFFSNLSTPATAPISWVNNPGLNSGSWFEKWNASVSRVLPYCSLAYLAWLGWSIFRFSTALYSTNRLKTASFRKAPVGWRLFMDSMAENMNIRYGIRIWITENIDTPSLIGWLKPVLLFPASSLTNLSQDQLESIIIHELAHIRRNDHLWNLVILLAESFLKFNPFATLLIEITREERENACDDWVLRFPYRPSVYAEALLTLEKNRTRREPALFLAAHGADRKVLLNRVRRILNVSEKAQEARLKRSAGLMVTGLVCLGFLLKPLREIPAPVSLKAPGTLGRQLADASAKKLTNSLPTLSNRVKPLGSNSRKTSWIIALKHAKNRPAGIGVRSQVSSKQAEMDILPLVINTGIVEEERAFSLPLEKPDFPKPDLSQAEQFPYVPANSFEAIAQRPDSLEARIAVQEEKLFQIQFKQMQLQEMIAVAEEKLLNAQARIEKEQLRKAWQEANTVLKQLQSKRRFQQDQLNRQFREQSGLPKTPGIRNSVKPQRPIVHI